MFDLFRTMISGKSSNEIAFETAIDQESLNRRLRNEARMEAIKREMGEKYILHPSHNKTRLETPRPV